MRADIDEILAVRGEVYGPPHVNHRRIAALWSVFLEHEVSASQAAMCMLLVKVARLIESPDHADSMDDLAGYLEVYRDCREADRER